MLVHTSRSRSTDRVVAVVHVLSPHALPEPGAPIIEPRDALRQLFPGVKVLLQPPTRKKRQAQVEAEDGRRKEGGKE
jgi:hypothetical protein